LERVSADRSETTEQLLSTNAQLRAGLDGLRSLGLTEVQLVELGKARKLSREVELRSPVSGYVLSRNVYPDQRLERREELYRIADLSRVWVIADLFERDAPYVRAGSPVQLSVPYQDARFDTRVTAVLPQFDPETRTLKVRLEIANPDLVLRPDMFVDVTLPLDSKPTLTIPVQALVDSGLRKAVFVDLGNGYFEPRRVEVGWRGDDRVQVLKGLMPGERIVVSGSFLLDSEARMRAAAAGVHDAVTDVVCGMEVDRGKATRAGRLVRHEGTDYFFCSDDCRSLFQRNPGRYLAPAPSRPQSPRGPASPPSQPVVDRTGEAPTGDRVSDMIRAADKGLNTTTADARGRSIFATDPVCGAEVETTAPKVLKATHAGHTYYFVSEDCRAAFLQEPAKYARTTASAAATSTVRDPVCGMEVDAGAAAAAGRKSEHKGETFYFCSDECKAAFDREPGKYVRR
jgi:RND family efflux transporter MFP subunit